MVPSGRVEDLRCPHCADPLAPDDVNIELLLAMCHTCEAMVQLAPHRDGPGAEVPAVTEPPAGITVLKDGRGLTLRRRWFEPTIGLGFLALWCLAWDGFLVVWYSISVSSLFMGLLMATESIGAMVIWELGTLMMMAVPVLHVAVGVAMTYWLLALVLNHTTVAIHTAHVEVTHGPLPWRSPDPVPVENIDQLYVVQRIGKNQRSYSVVARRTDRTSVHLLSGLTRDVQARFLEQRIEGYLGLTDQPVAGEYTG